MVPGRETNGGEVTKGTSRIFSAGGRENYSNPLWKVLAALLALPLGGAFVGGIVSYRSGLSAVDERISDHKELNKTLNSFESDIKYLRRDVDEVRDEVNVMKPYFEPNNSKVRKK